MGSLKIKNASAQQKPKSRPSQGPSQKKTTHFKQKDRSPSKKQSGKKSPGTFVRAPAKLSRAEEARLDRIREQSERKAEREAKKLQQKKQQKRKMKILAKKNKKGQPVMGGRMQLLLEKIEKRYT